MSSDYTERIQETKNVTEPLRALPADLVAVELLIEGREVIAAEPEARRSMLEHYYFYITNSVARVEMQRQRAEAKQLRDEAQLSEQVEDWLADLNVHTPNAAQKEVDHFSKDNEDAYTEYNPENDFFLEYRDAAGKIDFEAIQRDQKRLEQTSVLEKLGHMITDIEFAISFGEDKHGLEWNGDHIVGAVWDVLALQKRLGISVATDKIRNWLTEIKPSNDNIRSLVTDYLIENALQGNDRESFIVAGRQFPESTIRHGQTLSSASKLVDLAIGFINAARPELDREALDIALVVLPYYDRISAAYPFMCARLGVALQSIDTTGN
jgi:hypothetical protein